VETGSPDDASYTRLRHLQTISEAALAHLRFDDLVSELLERVTGLLGTDTAAVLLLDDEADELVATAARGLEEEVEARVRVPLRRGFAGRIAAERTAVIVPDVASADIFNPILREKGLQSLLGVPLLVQGELIGVLHVGTLEPRDFTGEDAELLQLAADRIALAIDHARLYESERDARAVAEHTAEQLRRLESLTETALAHLTLDDLLDELLGRIRDLIGTDTVIVQLLDPAGENLALRAILGLEATEAIRAPIPLGEGLSGRVAETGAPVVVEDVQAEAAASGSAAAANIASILAVPLIVGGSLTGVLGVGTWEKRKFAPADVDILERAADRIALAMENARLYSAEREARAVAEHAAERIRRIESISEVALHHIDLDDELLENLLGRVREVLEVDIAGLLVADESKQTLVARAAEGVSHEVERGVPVPIGRGFAGTVAERREPMTVEDTSEIELVSPLLVERGVRSLLGIPLLVEDRLLGVLLVGTIEKRVFSEDDLALLGLAGERLTVALEHSRVYEREHFVAETLQRSLLPEQLPQLQGAEVASHYLPGEDEAVGGDWYDVIVLRDGRVALAMGDVVSHGVRAASIMGQLRNALRAYAAESEDPSAMAERLNAITREIEGHEMATLAYLVYEPGAGTLSYVSAGHPPPVILMPDGGITLLEEGRGPPLGATPDAAFEEAHAVLSPGATLLLYTDGLVERRDMWIDEGLERLCEVLPAVAGREPGEVVDYVIDTLLPGRRATDDVAVLALRVQPLATGTLRLDLPADPTVLASLRSYLRAWLAEAGASEDETYDVLVAATEAAANAVEHAYGPGDATFRVEANAGEGREVTLLVRDDGSWRPPRGHNRGRGTLLMQELMDEFEVKTGETGTEVRMVKRLADTLAVV
jgi:GAF domain-containing protein/anti-sigma regulatory factor (Ser/Thr protein kinase)